MGINTQVKEGVIEVMDFPVTVWDLDETCWHHNPSIARDDTGQIWVTTRHHDELPEIRYANILHPYSHPPSKLMLAKLDEKTLKVSGVKHIKPDPKSPKYILEKEIEDVRIYFRDGKLYGVGAVIDDHSFSNDVRIYQVEVLIDYKTGIYKMTKRWPCQKGTMEKNWSPPIIPARTFDYIYSPTQVVIDDKVQGDPYSGKTHGGSQVLPYKDGWLRVAHQVVNVRGITHRWYVSVVEILDYAGHATHNSQFFDLSTGWRPQIRESVEFISGALWSEGKEGEELLISYGLRDETCAFVRLPMSALKFTPLDRTEQVVYYNWTFKGPMPTKPSFWQGKKFAGSLYHKPLKEVEGVAQELSRSRREAKRDLVAIMQAEAEAERAARKARKSVL